MNTPDKKTRYRYPGTKPFNEDEASLFNGRDEDITGLCELISVHNLIVLYGRSGLGKSSLLNAGVQTRFRQESNIDSLFVRFGAYFEDNHTAPVQMLANDLNATSGAAAKTFLSEKFNRGTQAWDNNLWYLLKNKQLANPANDTFVLIFDQFEEIFTYPEAEIAEFKKQLSELLFVKVPQEIRNVIKESLEQNINLLTKEETTALFTPLNIKILFSLRSDKLSLLNKFTDYFPAILQNCYELKPLTAAQATTAIEGPAKLTDPSFFSAPFSYTGDALKLIISALLSGKKNSTDPGSRNEIETFQLQIVCKFAEDLVIENGKTNISTEDLGNIKEIFENHNKNNIKKLPENDRLPARVLIEEKLIIDGLRVSMPIPFILRDTGMTKELLDHLISTHIIRPEQNNTIEISHDTLIEPILKYYEERKREDAIALELKQKEDQIIQLKKEQEIHLKRQEEKQALELEKLQGKRTRLVTYFVLFVTATLICFIVYNNHINTLKAAAFQYYKKTRITAASDPTKALIYADSAIFLIPTNDSTSWNTVVRGKTDLIKNNLFYHTLLTTKPGNFISISDDGTLVVTCDSNGNVSVRKIDNSWSKAYPSKLAVRAAGFSHDNKKLLLGAADGTLVLWNLANGSHALLAQNDSTITTAIISPNGSKMLAVVRGSVKVLDSAGQQLFQVPGKGYTCAAFCPDNKKILTGGSDGVVSLWDDNGRPLRRYVNYDFPITCLAFSPGGLLFASGSLSGFVNIWHISEVYKPRVTFGDTLPVTSVCFVNVEKKATYHLVCVGYSSSKIDLWRINHTKIESTNDSIGYPLIRDMPVYWYTKENQLLGHSDKVTCIRKLSGDRIVTASDDGTAREWYWMVKKDSVNTKIND